MGETIDGSDKGPEFWSETATGTQFEEALFYLLTRGIDAMTFDGHRLVGVNTREYSRTEDMVTATCRDDEGRRHVFTYTLDPGAPISHEVLENETD